MEEKYLFLDFNGTVLDDVDLCIDLLNHMLKENGKPIVTKERYQEIFQFPIRAYYEAAGLDLEQNSFADLADYFIVEYTRRNVLECKIYPDVVEFIQKVKALGYKVVLFSASKLNLLLDQLRDFEILSLFDDVIGLDNHHANSKLELAKAYLENHQIHVENTYFIGDTDHDAEVARACQAKCLLVCRGHQNQKVLAKTGYPVVLSLLDTIGLLC